MRRIVLRPQDEVELALKENKTVFQEEIYREGFGGRVIVYIEVPFEELVKIAR